MRRSRTSRGEALGLRPCAMNRRGRLLDALHHRVQHRGRHRVRLDRPAHPAAVAGRPPVRSRACSRLPLKDVSVGAAPARTRVDKIVRVSTRRVSPSGRLPVGVRHSHLAYPRASVERSFVFRHKRPCRARASPDPSGEDACRRSPARQGRDRAGPSRRERGHVHVERARLAARVTRLEVAEPAAVLHLAPVLDARRDDLLEQPHQRRSLRAVEVPEEPLDGSGPRRRDALRAPRALRRQLERDDARVLPLPAPQQPIVLEPVDEPHRARVRQAEHAREVIDRAAAVDAERRQRRRPCGRVARRFVDGSLHGAGDRHRHRAEHVLQPGVAHVVHE